MRRRPTEINHFLPFGEMLRTFVEQSAISKGDLSKLLRARGVFTESTEKSSTIPIFRSTILSPDEFDNLIECYRVREDSPKTITQTIPLQTEDPLVNHMPVNVMANFDAELEFSNYKLTTASDFVAVSDDADHVKLDFEIERTDTSKSWCESTNFFSGAIELKRITDGDSVKLAMTYTAKETLGVARTACRRVVDHLKDTGCLPRDESPRRVLFSSFTNQERVQFLLNLTVNNASSCLRFNDVVDIAVSPDSSAGALPDALAWSEERIRDLRCKGRSLHETEFIEDVDCHQFIMLYGIEASLDFEIRGATGYCRAAFAFPRFESKRDPNSELVVNVEEIRVTSGEKRVSLLRTAILEVLQDLVVSEFSDYCPEMP